MWCATVSVIFRRHRRIRFPPDPVRRLIRRHVRLTTPDTLNKGSVIAPRRVRCTLLTMPIEADHQAYSVPRRVLANACDKRTVVSHPPPFTLLPKNHPVFRTTSLDILSNIHLSGGLPRKRTPRRRYVNRRPTDQMRRTNDKWCTSDHVTCSKLGSSVRYKADIRQLHQASDNSNGKGWLGEGGVRGRGGWGGMEKLKVPSSGAVFEACVTVRCVAVSCAINLYGPRPRTVELVQLVASIRRLFGEQRDIGCSGS